MRFLTRNNVRSTLAEPIGNSDTEIFINVAQAPFRNPPEPYPNDSNVVPEDKEERVRLTIAFFGNNDNRIEIVEVLEMVPDPANSVTRLRLTVQRAIVEEADGGSPQPYEFPEGATIYLSNTADAINAKLSKFADGAGSGVVRVKTLSPEKDEIILYTYQE